MAKMATMPIYGQNLKKNQPLGNQKADDLESWYAALGTQVLPSMFKWWPWNDLDLFYGMVKGVGSQTCRIGLVNRPKIKVAGKKWHSTCLCAEHFNFNEQHLFSCLNPLILYYRVLNIGRVAIFYVFWSFLHLWSQNWSGSQPPYKTKFWQCWDLLILYRFLWDSFCKQGVPFVINWKIRFFFFFFFFFFTFKNVKK